MKLQILTMGTAILGIAAGALAGDLNAPAAVAHRAEIRRLADDPEQGRATLEAALKDEDPYVRRFAEERLGKLQTVKPLYPYRANVPLTQNPVYDHPLAAALRVTMDKTGTFSLKERPPVSKGQEIEVELSLGRVYETLYVWVNDIFVGQYLELVNPRGNDFVLDITAETKWGGEPNKVVVKRASGAVVPMAGKVEVFVCEH